MVSSLLRIPCIRRSELTICMVKTPDNMTSWEFFDFLLEKANVVGTPGSGFGPSGEGYFRLTAFGSYENTLEAIKRIENI